MKNVPKEYEHITSFGEFYEFIIINFGIHCKTCGKDFINFSKGEIQDLYDAWNEYGLIERPDLAYNISIQNLKATVKEMVKDEDTE